MAFISFQPTDFFNIKTWAGTGATHGITGVGFQPALTWIKSTDYTFDHTLTDAARGVDSQLNTNNAYGESTNTDQLTAFDSDGFTLGVDSAEGTVNNSGNDYVGWNWKGGTTTGITTNGSTTITPSAYSFNQTAGFSVVKYTGNETSGAKIAHGLGATPDLVIVKRLSSGGEWDMVSKHLGATYYIRFDNNAKATGTWAFNDTLPDSVNFTVGDNAETNSTGGCVAYCFANKKGYSKVMTWEGNGSTDGTFHFFLKPFKNTFDMESVSTFEMYGIFQFVEAYTAFGYFDIFISG